MGNLTWKMWQIGEKEQIIIYSLLFAYSQIFFPFCERELLFMWSSLVFPPYIGSWLLKFSVGVLTINTANSASSHPLVFPYFTQPRENPSTYSSAESLSRTSFGSEANKKRFSYPNLSLFNIFLVLVIFHSLCCLIFGCRPLKK